MSPRWHAVLLASVLVANVHVASAAGGALAQLRAKQNILERFERKADGSSTPGSRRLSDSAECDNAYYSCLWDTSCTACIQELSATSIDDDYVTDDELDGYNCNEFIDFLHDHNLCSATTCNDPHKFWSLIEACNEDEEDDDDFIDDQCSSTECVVTHEEYLGDGWCDYDTGGCYNSEACGYDHGDCCASTCVPTPSITCGDHGYECIDPTQQTSCDEDTTYTVHMYDAYGDGWNGAAYTIAEIQSRVQQATGTLATGHEGSDDVCLLPGCYLMVVSAGSWATEATWAIDDSVSGGAPTECKFSIDGSFCNNLSGENSEIPSCGEETDDAPVNVDDDCADNLYQLVLIDAYGDGWNGADYTLSAHGAAGNTGETISTGTLDQGFQSTESVCLPHGCYTMTVASGDWSSEISWEVGNSDAGLVATSGAPVSCDFPVGGTYCANTCQPVSNDDELDDDNEWYYYFYYGEGGDTCDADDQALYTVAMSDSYGDGWNGAHYTISALTGSSKEEVKSGTLASGLYGEDHVCLDENVCYEVLLTSGNYDEEVTWEIGKYGVGLVAGGAGANSPMGCHFSTDGTCENTCVVTEDDDSTSGACSGMPGSGSSYSLMLYDSAGDGWNGAGYTITNQNGQIKASGTLNAGMSSQEDMCLPVGCYSLEVTSGGHADEVSWFLGEAGISGGAPSNCQFNVGNPSNCPTYCEVVEDDSNSGGGGGGGGGHHHCSTGQSIAGASAMTIFQGCSDPHIGSNDLPDKDEEDLADKDWGKLDEFEACALDSTTDNWPEACMSLLYEATSSSDKLVKKISKNLVQGAGTFCVCGATGSAASPSCNSFHQFNAMLHESIEACNALDAIDCDYLRVWTEKCSQNLVAQFGLMDLSADGQCAYIDAGCGGLDDPKLRHWDCLDPESMNPVQLAFIQGYEDNCQEDEGDDSGEDDKDGDDRPSKSDDNTGTTDDSSPSDHKDREGNSPHKAAGTGAGTAVGIVIGVVALLVVVCGGGLYWYKKQRQGGEGYVSGATTFSPMVFGNKPPVSFNQLKTEVTATELSSGTGNYTPVGSTEGV